MLDAEAELLSEGDAVAFLSVKGLAPILLVEHLVRDFTRRSSAIYQREYRACARSSPFPPNWCNVYAMNEWWEDTIEIILTWLPIVILFAAGLSIAAWLLDWF